MYSFLDYLVNDNYTFHPKQVFQLVYPSMIVNTGDIILIFRHIMGNFWDIKSVLKSKIENINTFYIQKLAYNTY